MLLLATLCLVLPSHHVLGRPLSDGKARAVAIERRQSQPTNVPNPNNTAGIAPTVWIPVFVVAVILGAMAGITWIKRLVNRSRAASAGQQGGNTREVTADQLTGQSRAGEDGVAGAAGASARRPRRNRRTPSQISTKSLPAYNREPGDEELVVIRGPQGMTDESGMTLTVPMPALDEAEGESQFASDNGSRNNSRLSLYDLPSPEHSPGLYRMAGTQDRSTASLLRPATSDSGHQSRRSEDTSSSVDETGSLRLPLMSSTDPRGEAPSYFEAVSLSDTRNANAMPEPPSSPPTDMGMPSTRDPVTNTVSHIRNFFGVFGSASEYRPPTAPTPGEGSRTAHARMDSSMSQTSSGRPHSSSSRIQPSGHRPGSSSSSFMSSFRNMPRQQSGFGMNNHRMNSSQISLNSISAPLTHTLVRSDFTFPKAGPTPEQLKLISSPGNFARFGVPFGPDAIAYASSSRQDLGPPPEFDAVDSQGHRRNQSSVSIDRSHSRGPSDASTTPLLAADTRISPGPSQFETVDLTDLTVSPTEMSVVGDTPTTSRQPSRSLSRQQTSASTSSIAKSERRSRRPSTAPSTSASSAPLSVPTAYHLPRLDLDTSFVTDTTASGEDRHGEELLVTPRVGPTPVRDGTAPTTVP